MTATPIRSLDARYYTDPEVFRIEQECVLAKTWQVACHASEIPEPGDYTTCEIADESLILVRDRDGETRAYFNVCQHRGHQLVKGSGNARVLVCPYHAWTYELTGGLRAAPNAKSVPGFNRNEICLSSVRVEEFLGFLFVNLDPDAEPMDVWFPGAREELQEWVPDWSRLKPLEWVEVPEACNWKISVENYSECYHCALCHPTFATGVVKPETYDIQPQGYCLRHTTQCQNLDQMTYPIDLSVPRGGEYSSWFLWPLFSFQVYPGNVLNTYHWRANAVDQITLWRGWYSVDGAESETVRKLAVQDRETTVAEDIDLVESVQRGLRSRGYRPGPLIVDPAGGVNSEHSVMHLQRWMREAVEGPQ